MTNPAWVLLGCALVITGCASGALVPADQPNALRLLDRAVTAAAHTEQAQPDKPSGKLCLTVEGPADDETPFTDDASTSDAPSDDASTTQAPWDASHAQPAADKPSSASDASAEAAPPAEPDSAGAAVATDEPVAEGPVIAAPEVSAPPPRNSDDLETVVEPLRTPDADALAEPPAVTTMDQAEEVITPRPQPASPFKTGTDEVALDRFARQVSDVPIDIRPTEGVMPTNLAAARFEKEPTVDETMIDESMIGETWSDETTPPEIFCSFTPWTICYRPLYFEDIPLERYGKNVGCLQTGLSGVKFYGSILALPYKMAVRPPRSCQCSNGFSRCGDCPLPGYGKRQFRLDAAFIEAAAVAGVVYILP